MTPLNHLVRRYGRSTGPRSGQRAAHGRRSSPVALVYRGPASSPGCPEAAAHMLSASGFDLEVAFIGPKEERSLCPASFADATLYVQPGGPDLDNAYRHLRSHSRTIRGFVAGGGHYLGICLGGYLAGTTPGFALIPGDSDQYIKSPFATVHTEEDAIVEVSWRGLRRQMYFQDGPYFQMDPDAKVTVLATYPNQTVAASVNKFGHGRVGVVGPHPEADGDWFTDVGLPDPGSREMAAAEARGLDLGLDLLNEVMRP